MATVTTHAPVLPFPACASSSLPLFLSSWSGHNLRSSLPGHSLSPPHPRGETAALTSLALEINEFLHAEHFKLCSECKLSASCSHASFFVPALTVQCYGYRVCSFLRVSMESNDFVFANLRPSKATDPSSGPYRTLTNVCHRVHDA